MKGSILLKKKDKKGWIKIVEAFLAIMLIAAILLTALNERSNLLGDQSEYELYQDYHESEIAVLKKIQLNDTIRDDILNISEGQLPVSGGDVPESMKNEVRFKIPIYLNCTYQICSVGSECKMDTGIEDDLFVEHIGIFANRTHYNPRKVNLFCWER